MALSEDQTKRALSPWEARFEEHLARLEKVGLRRHLRRPEGVDFSSNDYLGFATDPALWQRWRQALERAPGELPLGAGASRLLRGELPLFSRVESRLARFCGRESALLFPSGYQANLALMSSLPQAGDVVYSDQLNHASLIDGLRLSQARRVVFRHNDLEDLRRHLRETPPASPTGGRWIVTESLFSMDGDEAPLQALSSLANEWGAALLVDESHATGVFGSGLVAESGCSSTVLASIHTGGKALGAAGAWIATTPQVREILINAARAFIFSTGVFPPLACALEQAVEHWEVCGADRARSALESAALLRARWSPLLPEGLPGRGLIIPLRAGSNEKSLKWAAHLAEHGFDVRAVRPPTVPEGTARLRITVSSRVKPEQVQRLGGLVEEWLRSDSVDSKATTNQAKPKQGAKQALFVTGTSTDVGKTVVSAALVRALQLADFEVHYHKPLQTGADSDTKTLESLTGISPHNVLHPTASFALPAAPSRAAAAEGCAVDLHKVVDRWAQASHDRGAKTRWVLEGAGGLLVPLTDHETTEDLIHRWDLPVLVVASTRLGTINHSLLTLRALKLSGIQVRALVLCGEPDPGLRETLLSFAPSLEILEFPWLESLSKKTLSEVASKVFPVSVLERLFA